MERKGFTKALEDLEVGHFHIRQIKQGRLRTLVPSDMNSEAATFSCIVTGVLRDLY